MLGGGSKGGGEEGREGGRGGGGSRVRSSAPESEWTPVQLQVF